MCGGVVAAVVVGESGERSVVAVITVMFVMSTMSYDKHMTTHLTNP
jgi:hypothetical protein